MSELEKENINTKEYWERQYEAEKKSFRIRKKRGRLYMQSLLPLIRLDRSFEGTIVDFGCGMGFGTAVLREAFPKATVIGVDHSESGIEFCRQHQDPSIRFLCASWEDVPEAEAIVSSHVMEHLADDRSIVAALRERCRRLLIATPYREDLNGPWAVPEHVNSYDEKYYEGVEGFVSAHVVPTYPTTFYFRLHHLVRNVYRFLARRRKRDFYRHVVFCFENNSSDLSV